MRCCSCRRGIAAGIEAQRMIVEYRQADGSSRFFGYSMTDGPLLEAVGQMVRGYHAKCWFVAHKREARGDAVSGRVLAGAPTGYDIDALVLSREDLKLLGITEAQALARGTQYLSTRLTRLREIAEELGLGVGDGQVQEAFLADERGSPYSHEHHHRLDTYQLIAHLRYAHAENLRSGGTHQDQHSELHARQSQQHIQADRTADGDDQDHHRDWRTQYTVTIE